MDFKQAKAIIAQIKKNASLLAKERQEQRKVYQNVERLISFSELNSLISKKKNFKYLSGNEESIINIERLSDNIRSFSCKYKREGTSIRVLLENSSIDILKRSIKEIKHSHIHSIRGNLITVYTSKTSNSNWKHPFHQCQILLKHYDESLNHSKTESPYKNSATAALGGDIGVHCDCDEFHYNFNYWISKINAGVSSRYFEKCFISGVTSETGVGGPLCIHLVKALKVLCQPLTVNMLAKYMKKDASAIIRGETSSVTITEKEYNQFFDGVEYKTIDYEKQLQLFEKEAKSFKLHASRIRENKKNEQEEKKARLEAAKSLLRDGIDKKIISECLKIDIKELEKLEV